MRFVQINLNNCEAAQDLLMQRITEIAADVAIISEPYRQMDGSIWIVDKAKKAAIWACGSFPFQEYTVREEKGYVVGKVNGIYVFSCYAPPSLTPHEFDELMDKIADEAKRFHPKIIAGDFNAWAEEWGSRCTNSRGQTLLESFAGIDLILANTGGTSTFQRNDRSSIIDLTFTSAVLTRDLAWRVSEEYTHSDHQAILFELPNRKANRRSNNGIRNPKHEGWVAKLLDEDIISDMAKETTATEGTADDKAQAASTLMTAACDAAMPRRRTNERRRPVYWWNEDIENL